MLAELSDFAPHKVPLVGHPLRSRFSTSKLYLRRLASLHCAWLEWLPCEGVDREFFVYLGWSLSPEVLPDNLPGDMSIYSLRGPANSVRGTLNVQQIEGRQVIEGFRIATPWDQLYELSPRVSDAERKKVMGEAYAQYLAVTDAERIEAVRRAMDEAFKAIHSVLPDFVSRLERLSSDA